MFVRSQRQPVHPGNVNDEWSGTPGSSVKKERGGSRMMDNLRFAVEAAWKVLLVGLVLGAGLPAVFAVGVRSLAWGAGGSAEVAVDSSRTRLGRPVAALCFAGRAGRDRARPHHHHGRGTGEDRLVRPRLPDHRRQAEVRSPWL